jgi:hypothetical protein
MPAVLVLLAVIALVLWIVFGFLIPPNANITATGRFLLAVVIIVLVLIFWYVLPIRIGG